MTRTMREKLGLIRKIIFNKEDEIGFFVFYPYGRLKPGSVKPYQAVQDLFDAHRTEFEKRFEKFSEHLSAFRSAIDDGEIPWVERGMFPKLDALVTYCIVREFEPKCIFEIGSGNSSHIMARALADNGVGQLTCIDPEPRRSIERLKISFEKRILNDSDTRIIESFVESDILFIDSSHLMFPGFDTDIELNRMFPNLPSGALVHMHDVFLPEDYPLEWFERRYSEQNALMGWILSGYFEVFYPGYFVATQMETMLRQYIGDLMPKYPRQNAGSIWLRKA